MVVICCILFTGAFRRTVCSWFESRMVELIALLIDDVGMRLTSPSILGTTPVVDLDRGERDIER